MTNSTSERCRAPKTANGVAKPELLKATALSRRVPARYRPWQPTGQSGKAGCQRCTSKPPRERSQKCGQNSRVRVDAKRKVACSKEFFAAKLLLRERLPILLRPVTI